MFRLIKWSIILGLIGGIWFLFSFFSNMTSSDKQDVKKDVIQAIDSGDSQKITDSLSKKIQDDFTKRKIHLLERVRRGIRAFIHDEVEEKVIEPAKDFIDTQKEKLED